MKSLSRQQNDGYHSTARQNATLELSDTGTSGKQPKRLQSATGPDEVGRVPGRGSLVLTRCACQSIFNPKTPRTSGRTQGTVWGEGMHSRGRLPRDLSAIDQPPSCESRQLQGLFHPLFRVLCHSSITLLIHYRSPGNIEATGVSIPENLRAARPSNATLENRAETKPAETTPRAGSGRNGTGHPASNGQFQVAGIYCPRRDNRGKPPPVGNPQPANAFETLEGIASGSGKALSKEASSIASTRAITIVVISFAE